MEAPSTPIRPHTHVSPKLHQSQSSTRSISSLTGEPYGDIGVFYHGIFSNKVRSPYDTVTYTMERAYPSNKTDVSDTFEDTPKRDPADPTTWPILSLPFHTTTGGGAPQHVNEMLTLVHYGGDGAVVLRRLLYEAVKGVETEDEKRVVERAAWVFWPCNVTMGGGWKQCSGVTKEEALKWNAMIDEEGWLLT
jgi:hypothetical protein